MKIEVKRYRQSVTQGEVELFVNGGLVIRYGDRITLGGEYGEIMVGHGSVYSDEYFSKIITDRVEGYAGKFLADHYRNTPITDKTLTEAYKGCVIPARHELYPAIKERIAEMAVDSRFCFYDEE